MKISIDKYDREWSRLVRERDEYRCQVCGKQSKYMNAHHFVRRSVYRTRLDVNNGISLCAQCHTFNSTFSAHQSPQDFKKWFKQKWATRAKILLDKEKQTMSPREAIKQFLYENRYQLNPSLYKEYVKTQVN